MDVMSSGVLLEDSFKLLGELSVTICIVYEAQNAEEVQNKNE